MALLRGRPGKQVTGAVTTLPLVFDAPRAAPGKPPRHLADLDPAGRRAAVAELGEPAFRAGQLSAHYFGRLVRDPAAMTDLPAAARGRGSPARCCPPLLTPVGELAATTAPPARRCGGCTTARWSRAC